MNRKCKTGKGAACLLVTATGPSLIPVLAPIIMWMSASEYANEHPCMSRTQYNGSLLSDLIVSATSSEGVYGGGPVDGSTAEPTPISTGVSTLSSVERETNDSDLHNEVQER